MEKYKSGQILSFLILMRRGRQRASTYHDGEETEGKKAKNMMTSHTAKHTHSALIFCGLMLSSESSIVGFVPHLKLQRGREL
jgi:hypothetical protein